MAETQVGDCGGHLEDGLLELLRDVSLDLEKSSVLQSERERHSKLLREIELRRGEPMGTRDVQKLERAQEAVLIGNGQGQNSGSAIPGHRAHVHARVAQGVFDSECAVRFLHGGRHGSFLSRKARADEFRG